MLIAVEHVGFSAVAWWNTTLWNVLKLSGVDCNPARCESALCSSMLSLACTHAGHNPAQCGIADCTLVDQALFDGTTHKQDALCDSAGKQLDTSENGCIPAAMRTAWPDTATDEAEACKAVIENSPMGNTWTSRLGMGWYMHPATRMVCPSACD